MAANPFDQFDAPKANPFDQFDPPPKPTASSSPASTPDLGTTAFWNKPANAGWGDYFLAHLAQPFKATTLDPRANLNEALVLGQGLSGGLSNFIPGVGARTAQAEKELDPQAAAGLNLAGYVLGPGKLGAAAKIGGKVSGLLADYGPQAMAKLYPWLGGVAGSAAEGGALGGIGAAGRGEDIWTGIKTGAGFSALGGALGGVVGRGGRLPPSPTADDLEQAAKAAYAKNDPVLFDTASAVHPELTATDNAIRSTQDLTGGYDPISGKWSGRSALAKSTTAIVDSVRNKAQLTGTQIQKAQDALDEIARSPRATDEDKLFAPQYSSALQKVMDNGLPLNAPSGFVGANVAEGDTLFGRLKDLTRIEGSARTQGWVQKAAVPGGPSVPSQASSFLRSDEGLQFAAPGTPLNKALTTLAATKAPPGTDLAPSAWDLRHALGHLAPAVALPIAGGVAEGHFDPQHAAAEAAIGLGLGYGLHRGVPAVQGVARAPGVARAIDAARTTAATGNYAAPTLPTTPFRDALRRLIFSHALAGQTP
jgi:hypothetical protein